MWITVLCKLWTQCTSMIPSYTNILLHTKKTDPQFHKWQNMICDMNLIVDHITKTKCDFKLVKYL
jgi:hypothetical protein